MKSDSSGKHSCASLPVLNLNESSLSSLSSEGQFENTYRNGQENISSFLCIRIHSESDIFLIVPENSFEIFNLCDWAVRSTRSHFTQQNLFFAVELPKTVRSNVVLPIKPYRTTNKIPSRRLLKIPCIIARYCRYTLSPTLVMLST